MIGREKWLGEASVADALLEELPLEKNFTKVRQSGDFIFLTATILSSCFPINQIG